MPRRSTLLSCMAVGALATCALVAAAPISNKPSPAKRTAKTGLAMNGVAVQTDKVNRRVNVTIDGKPFTSLIWSANLKKPVLYPLIDASGVTVSRGWPLDPRPGERTDHPHHDGLWFNYGNANGFDFWNNSDAIKPENREKMGTVVFERLGTVTSGLHHGSIETASSWITGKGDRILRQNSKYVFTQQGQARFIDLTITLEALDKVVFNDDKEGMLGMRVARWLESPDEKGGVFTDASGHPTTVAAVSDLVGVAPPTGEYLTSEGVKGGKVWATRARWCALSGHTGDHSVTIAVFDHPKNPGYPTYWHARGYGLFAANPLGKSVFDPKQAPLKFTLEKGQSATFHYRVEIAVGALDKAALDREADAFAVK